LESQIYGNRGLTLTRGSGTEIYDKDGNRYLDFFMGHGAALFGHNHPALVKALKDASERPWTIGGGFESEERKKACEALSFFLPDYRIYWANSGAEAIESALKICALNRPKRSKVLALRRGFHGRTLGALSLTFNPKYRSNFTSFLFNVEHYAPQDLPPKIDEDTLAVFVEPIQGEGGVYPLDASLGEAISEQCRKTKALLVADEIQTGFGRCGEISISSTYGLNPDIICLSKGVAGGLPVGLTLWRKELSDFVPQSHGSTAGGNPLVCSVAFAAIQLLKEEKYPKQASEKGEYFRFLLSSIKNPLIEEIRGQGLLVGVQLRCKASSIIKDLQSKGLLALPAGPTVLRFMPPFVAEKEHFEEATSILEEVLANHA
jgi:acetylornithine/LysW-gamma-L-lysine aminotransferase